MRVLGIFAHPDDEIIFGWPVLQNSNIHKKVITAVGGANRIAALNKVAEVLYFESVCLRMKDNRVSGRMDDLDKITTKTVEKFKPDIVFTHNPHGEYGHPDHLAIFNSVYRNPNVKNLLITDISCNVKSRKFCFPKIKQTISQEEFKKFYIKKLCRCTRNISLFNEIKKIYKQHNAWTWLLPDRFSDCCLYFAKSEHFHRKKILDMLIALLLPENVYGAEIGVFKGETTLYLASQKQVRLLYAIDPWMEIDDIRENKTLLKEMKKCSDLGESINTDSWNDLYKYMKPILEAQKNVRIMKMTSDKACGQVPNLDFVFIDGNHQYEEVKNDIEKWANKIKPGGIIAGHDYTWNGDHKTKRGVCMAVDEYFSENYDEFEEVIDVRRNPYINKMDDRVWWQQKIIS